MSAWQISCTRENPIGEEQYIAMVMRGECTINVVRVTSVSAGIALELSSVGAIDTPATPCYPPQRVFS